MTHHLAHLLEAATPHPPRALRVRIDHVAVAGVAWTPAEARHFSEALAAQLRQLARSPGWPAGAASVRLPGVVAPPLAAAAGEGPRSLGRQVARSVFDAVLGTVR